MQSKTSALMAGRFQGLGLGLLLLTSCGPRGHLTPLILDRAPDLYRSNLKTRDSVVRVDRISGGLRCVIVADPDPGRNHSGGIMIPLDGARGCRMTIGFKDPTGIVVAYAEAYDAQKRQVAAWRTEQWARLHEEKTTYTFVPNERTKDFRPSPAKSTGPIDAIHLYVDLQRGTGAVLDVSNVEAIH